MISTIVLICGVAVSLAIGVLIAYGLCLGMFAIFRIHSLHTQQVAASRTAPRAVLTTARN